MTNNDAFKALYETIVTLRGPDGCSWDREQTPFTLRGALIEETYECLEAIDENDSVHICEELGDLFLVVTMLGYMHEQQSKFSVADTLVKVNEKLIRRHPHVFSDTKVKDVGEILDNWNRIKKGEEGRGAKDSILDEVSAGFPPMDRAYKLQKKAAKAGFDWQDTEGVIAKIIEELEEVREQVAVNREQLTKETNTDTQIPSSQSQVPVMLEEELGDLLFSVINLCRFLKVEPSVALRRTNGKFVQRFKYVEKKMKETGQDMKSENLEVMEAFWNDAKEVGNGS
ncbi:MAG: nucleoside triphosphate pyrophosphohydrolase [Treponema sp.]|jgi:tetrapyrrole methylase family protein/MazG family protein|nr:nucleoside triphosphate pyrophosphohydrolase [Treponema sp.]